MRVIFSVFVSRNGISEHYVFVKEVFRGLCLWVRIFDICHEAYRSLSQKVGLSYLKVFGCGGHHEVFWKDIVMVIPQLYHLILRTRKSIFKLSYSYISIRTHTRVHGGLYIYLHKMPGKHPGYGQMLGGEEFG
jgi:hypothetical protein